MSIDYIKLLSLKNARIKCAHQLKRKHVDDKGYLLLILSNNKNILISSCYGDYTGNSLDEYPTNIKMDEVDNKYLLENFDAIPRFDKDTILTINGVEIDREPTKNFIVKVEDSNKYFKFDGVDNWEEVIKNNE